MPPAPLNGAWDVLGFGHAGTALLLLPTESDEDDLITSNGDETWRGSCLP
jgi:hypothetical protein